MGGRGVRGGGVDPGIGATGEVTMILTNSLGSFPVVAEGTSLVSYVETKDLYADSMEIIKFVQRLRYIIRDMGTSLQVYFKTRNHSNDDYVESDVYTLSGAFLSVRLPGARFVRVVFRDVAPSDRWLLSGFEILGQLGGKRDFQ